MNRLISDILAVDCCDDRTFKSPVLSRYSRYREVYDGGDAYYRAVAISVIEDIFVSSRKDYFLRLRDTLSCVSSRGPEKEAHENLLLKLERTAGNINTRTLHVKIGI